MLFTLYSTHLFLLLPQEHCSLGSASPCGNKRHCMTGNLSLASLFLFFNLGAHLRLKRWTRDICHSLIIQS